MATNGIQGGNIVIGMRELLEEMVARSASDLHITAGLSPQYRIDGSIVPTQFPALAGDDTRRLAYSILNDEQKKRFENDHELDFSFGVQGVSRFRANVFQQRGVNTAFDDGVSQPAHQNESNLATHNFFVKGHQAHVVRHTDFGRGHHRQSGTLQKCLGAAGFSAADPAQAHRQVRRHYHPC